MPMNEYNEVYVALFNHPAAMEQLFPERNFRKGRDSWNSPTTLEGEPHPRKDKTIVGRNVPFMLKEQGGDTLHIQHAIMQRDGISKQAAFRKIAEAAEYELPTLSKEALEQYQESVEKNLRLQKVVELCNTMLKLVDAAKPTRDYLKARGITEEEIEKFQLGYFPSRYELKKELEAEGIDILEFLPLLEKIDNSKQQHCLLFPWFSNGNVTNLKARSILNDVKAKYLNWKEGGRGMFNLPGCRRSKISRLVIVEGEIDCIAATTMLKYFDVDVVAAGTFDISKEQAKACRAAGYQNVTICFDADAGKDNRSKIERAIDILQSVGFDDIFILEMPGVEEGKVDPAALRMHPGGVELFVDAFNKAIDFPTYLLNGINDSFNTQRLSNGELPPRLQKELLRELVTTAGSIVSRINRDIFYIAAKTTLESNSIPVDALKEEVEQVAKERNEARTKEANGEMIAAMQERNAAGDHAAVSRIAEKIQQRSNVATFDNSTKPYSIKQWKNDLLKQAPLLKTGFPSLDKIVGFPSGNLSIVAGRTSHGKTTFMLNSILKAVEANPGKTFFYFNYEEPQQKIVAKLLNIQANKNFTTHDPDALNRTKRMPKEMERRNNVDYIEYVGMQDALFLEDPELSMAADVLDSYFLEQEGSPARLYVECNSYSLENLIAKIHAACSRCDVGGIFVDYIQKIRPDKEAEMRMAMVESSRKLQTAAKDYNIPIIAGAQFRRDAAGKANNYGMPTLEMLKESGSLEEDANVVIGIYNHYREGKDREKNRRDREAYKMKKGEDYTPEPQEDLPELIGTKRTQFIDLIVLKNREGAVNEKVRLYFDSVKMNYRETIDI